MSDKPVFIDTNVQTIIDEMIADYEERTGRKLQPAQIERLLLNTWAYRESLIRSAIQDAALQNLVDFSRAPVIDYLGALVGVSRLAASPAVCTLRLTFSSGHPGVTIPALSRVATDDSRVVFEIIQETVVAAGVTSVDVNAEAQTSGVAGNGYAAGRVKTIIDPRSFWISAANLAETSGGAESESDDALRERIKLAPASFSNAGSRGAYIFYTKSASSSIIDVVVLGPPDTAPGTVRVVPLIGGGVVTPQPILDEVEAVLSAEDVRPLTDTVEVVSPTIVTYRIDVTFTAFVGHAADIEAQVTTAVTAYANSQLLKLGRDIVRNSIISAVMSVEGVYNCLVEINQDGLIDLLPITPVQVGVADGIFVTLTGTTNG